MIGVNTGKLLNTSLSGNIKRLPANFALQFDGSHNYLNLGTLGTLGSNLSKGFYIKFDIVTTGTSIAEMGFSNGVGAFGVLVGFNESSTGSNASGKIRLFFRDTGGVVLSGATTSATNFNDGKRHTIVIAAIPASNVIFISVDNQTKSVSYATQSTPASFANLTKNYYIGARNNNTVADLFVSATIDNIQIGTNGAGALYSSTPPLTTLDKIRGWNYSSNYDGGSSTNEWYVETAQIPFDMTDIAAAGIGVVRIYADETNAASHLAALDQISAAGLKAIVIRFITYNVDYSVATGGANRTAAIAKFTGMITNLKGHSAIIGWGFGNENNASSNRTSTTLTEWYTLLEAATKAGKAIDSTRVYLTANQEITDVAFAETNSLVPSLDIWGINIYRGTTFTTLATDILQSTTRPVILTEFGVTRATSGTTDQNTQASQVLALMKEAESYFPIIRGWVHFKYTDSTTSGALYGATAAQAQATDQSRTKYALYTTISTYCTGNTYLAIYSPVVYARYALSEGTGTTTADGSGNANTGTLTGSPLPSWVNGF